MSWNSDLPLKKTFSGLPEMNRELIRDEGHRNKMSLSELEQRMSGFLRSEYGAVIVSSGRKDIGYVLYRREPDWLYLRQIFIIDKMRRKGIGRIVIKWIKDNLWMDCKRIRTDILVNNTTGINFWKAVGFKEYCITMEMENK